MKKEDILKTIQKIRKDSKKRNFVQSFDLIINLKDFDLKKDKLDSFFVLPKSYKEYKVCAFLDKKLDKFDKEILVGDFEKYKDKEIKSLGREYDYFVAHGSVMGKLAGVFGKILSGKGKMPNPKAGAIMTPETNVDALKERFKKLKRLETKGELSIKCGVGLESMEDEEIVNNAYAVYDHIIHLLPKEKNNVDVVYLKLTMGPSFEVGVKDGEEKKDS